MERKTCKHAYIFSINFCEDIRYNFTKCVKTNIDFVKKARLKIDSEGLKDGDRKRNPLDVAEEMVYDLVFTKDEIQRLKEEICKKIMETETPFDIECVDVDGNYYYEDGELLEDRKQID